MSSGPLQAQIVCEPLREVRFRVFGLAQPKGSARAFVPKGWKRAIVTSANPKGKGWEGAVAEAAGCAAAGVFFRGAVRLEVVFVLPRPKSLGRKAAQHTKRPDLDKLTRSINDALSGVIWDDDSQVVRILATKVYASGDEPARAEVTVREVLD